MPDQTEFINLYIKTLVEEVTELTKTKILLVAKETFSKAEIDEINKKLEELEESVAKEKDDAAQVWKTALEEKDVETTGIQGELDGLKRQLANKENECASLVEEKNAGIAKVAELREMLKAKDEQIKLKDVKIEELQPKPIVKPVEIEKPKKGLKVKGVHSSF